MPYPIGNGPGRQVSCTVTQEMYDRFAAHAKEERRTIAQMLRIVLDRYFEGANLHG
jgi:hypothetical protein